jgi:putative ATP-dependent endonuclease of the OLD family
MASELVHLNKKDWTGLRLALIEELEAHLHPQAQMQIIESLQRELGLQIILTTHSPNLASKVKLDDLMICHDSLVFPMGKDSTALNASDHRFLECFLDVTKSNLFFARGVIMVEGWAEEILLPPLAKKMKKAGLIAKDLTEAGVTVVNVGGTSFLRYSRIFVRKEKPMMDTPVAIVTDVDVAAYIKVARVDADGKAVTDEGGKPIYDYLERQPELVAKETIEEIRNKETTYTSQNVRAFVAPQWTLEYCLLKSSSLSSPFKQALRLEHPQVDANDLERELARKLINKLDKVGIAYQLARLIEDDLTKKPPEASAITIDKNDGSIKYLLEAIKYACSH